jgi:hypothetical protein
MENFKSTYGPMIFFFVIAAIVVFAMCSCNGANRAREMRAAQLHSLQTEGLDRLMVEECGMFEVDYDKHIAIDTTIKLNKYNRHLRVYKLNADSTRYVLCK